MSDGEKKDIDSYDFPSRVQKGLDLLHKDSNKALELFDELLNDFFRFTPSEINELGYSSLIINSLNAKGSILNAYDDIDNAEKCFDLVLNDYDSQDFTSLINKALILRKKMHLEESLDYYDKILDAYPNKRELVLAMKSEVYDDLKINLSQANLDDYKDSAKELIERGLSFKDKNLVLDSLNSYQEAIEKDSRCKYLVMGLMDEVKKEFFKIFLYEDIDVNANDLSQKKGGVLHYLFIKNNLFYAYMLNEEILEEDSDDLFALNAKGMIFFFLDDCNLAVECFNKCILLDDKYLYPYFNKAIALARANKIDEAKESYEHIKALPEMISNPNEEEMSIFNRAIIANAMYSLGF